MKTVKLPSAEHARAFLWDLQRQGYDLFRGQSHPWPLAPTLLRTNGPGLEVAKQRLSTFMDWCAEQPRLAVHTADATQLVGIAQHYGVPTHLLDVSTSVEVALFFALNGNPPPDSPHAVVYAWKSTEFEGLNGVSVMKPEIDNLWRMEAQKGLFLEIENGTALDTIPVQKILFPRDSVRGLPRQEDIYPVPVVSGR